MNSTRKKIVWRLEALAYDLICGFMRLFPFDWISGFGSKVLRLIGPMTSKHKVARAGMTLAFPEKSDAEINQLLKDMWDNLGRTFAEFPIMHRLKAFEDNSRITIKGLELLEANAPAILVGGHFANWEVLGLTLTQSTTPFRITYRRINNPYIDARVREEREAYGTKFLVQKSTHRGGRELFEALRNGESIGIMNDQKFGTGLSIPFFGHNAMTAQGATRLALKTGRPLLPMSVTRNGPHFTATFYEPIKLEKTGDRDIDVREGVTQVTKFIEDRIRENPAQWFWVHRRWPNEVYEKDKSDD